MPKTIAFIHGNFVTKHCWDHWVARFQARGYTCKAIAYPMRDASVEALRRRHPDPALGRLALPEVLEHHERELKALPEKPIVIGHSFGGFLTQQMVARGLAAAAVAIDSVPPAGVITTEFSFLKSLWPVLNPLKKRTDPYMMSFEEFQYAFVNGMPYEAQKKAYDSEVVPESRVLGGGALSALGKIDFKREHAPLLLIAGEKDHIMPASLNRSNYEKYKASGSVVAFKQFPGRNHYLIGAPGWEEVADYAVEWAEKAVAESRSPVAVG